MNEVWHVSCQREEPSLRKPVFISLETSHQPHCVVHRSAGSFACSSYEDARTYIYSLPRPSQAPTSSPKLITAIKTSTSSQFSYNVRPPTPPKPSNNHPIQSIPQPNTQTWLSTLSPTTTARSSPPPGSASKLNPSYATISHEQTKTTHQVGMADQTHH